MSQLVLSNGFWVFACGVSAIWAAYGGFCEYEEKKEHEVNICPHVFVAIVSELLGAFAGFCCVRILARRLMITGLSFGVFEVALLIGAFVGITGYTYKIGEIIEKY